ncbi:hypothetical protein J4E08_15895 [Sagittula sp. NFXS13]|uniref:DNA-binding response OmpR family regulator n=1 Tax=Sagittula marina TaxID=943940 RepID=A0A7W6DPV9_9RHOB|nr:hypothetical protein [Sagittula marina]MBB3986963.1 DNA-binding response OmpR family regulator [Sagittula marina]
MRILIVQSNLKLAELWQTSLVASGADVTIAATEFDAFGALEEASFDVIILDIVIQDRAALGISDLACVLQPDARLLFVTASNFFSDGSIFLMYPNACAHLHCDTKPDDLTAVAEHYAAA